MLQRSCKQVSWHLKPAARYALDATGLLLISYGTCTPQIEVLRLCHASGVQGLRKDITPCPSHSTSWMLQRSCKQVSWHLKPAARYALDATGLLLISYGTCTPQIEVLRLCHASGVQGLRKDITPCPSHQNNGTLKMKFSTKTSHCSPPGLTSNSCSSKTDISHPQLEPQNPKPQAPA